MRYIKHLLAASILLNCGMASAVEPLRLFPIYPNTTNNVVGSTGVDLPVTEFAVNSYQVNVFQPCTVLQFGGFYKSGNCSTYKSQAQLWYRPKSTATNLSAIPVAVLQYATGDSAAYATPNGQPFIVGNIIRYIQQSCDATQVDATKYAKTSEPCSGSLQVWKRTTPVQ